MLVWIVIGNVFAVAFLSAGPGFYGLITGDTLRFSEQAMALSSTYGAADLQAYLWDYHIKGEASLASGISAFPSVHVGLIAMNTFFAFEVSRRLGLIAAGYTLFIMASSVALGWHYPIDGYASVVIVAVIYYLVKAYLQTGNRYSFAQPMIITNT
jgi:membrane-associated phospholipid phosphatase